MPKGLFIFLQVLAAIIIVLVLYMLTLAVINMDALVIDFDSKVKQNQKINIISGFAGISRLAGRSYNTINPFADNFKKVAKSLNDHGGAQFTYQFWMKIEDTNADNFKDLVILMKGDNRKFNRALYNPKSNEKIGGSEVSNEYLIKCPLIKFGKTYKEMKVEFNTNRNENVSLSVNMEGSSNPLYRKNLLSLSPGNWYLISVVFEDNFSFASGSENGVKVTLYVNDFPYQVASAATDPLFRNNTLKQNDGNLYLFPNAQQPSEFIKLGNIAYYNYAASQAEISNTFLNGPPKFEFTDSDESKNIPAHVSAYNKIDIYNY